MTEDKKGYAYESVPVSEEAIKEIAEIREAFKILSARLNSFEGAVPKNVRYLALANTSLEQAAMWATKSITHF